MDNHITKRILLSLLAMSLSFSLLLGCGSRQDEPVRAPITTAGVTATLVSSNVHNASSIEKQNFTDDVPATEPQHVIVYVTETGSKYHCSGCSYLAKSCIPIELETAKQSYGPCSKCCPPK